MKIEEVPTQEPKTGEVRLRVKAIGLNRSESMFMHGYYLEPTKLPAKLGYEASGVVTCSLLIGLHDPPRRTSRSTVQKTLAVRGDP